MKNYKFLVIAFIILSFFQCIEPDCNSLSDFRTSIILELSSTESSFSRGDELLISTSFSSTIPKGGTELEYSIENQALSFGFELFELQANNGAVQGVTEKIELSSTIATIAQGSVDYVFNVRMECDEICSFDIKLDLLEEGYYGLVLKTAHFVSMTDCVVASVIAEKSNVQNFEILDEIGTDIIIYNSSTTPYELTETNSFFFKVE